MYLNEWWKEQGTQTHQGCVLIVTQTYINILRVFWRCYRLDKEFSPNIPGGARCEWVVGGPPRSQNINTSTLQEEIIRAVFYLVPD